MVRLARALLVEEEVAARSEQLNRLLEEKKESKVSPSSPHCLTSAAACHGHTCMHPVIFCSW